MNGETLFLETDYFKAFPTSDEVFARDVDQHAEYLLPLASVSLSHIHADWAGAIHFILPFEPRDGVVGEETEERHNYLCRKNWVGYRMIDGKCELACDIRFFQKADLQDDSRKGRVQLETIEALDSHYDKLRQSFEKQRRHFQENHALHRSGARRRSGKYREDDRLELVRHLGGVAGYGNWPETGDFPFSVRSYMDRNGEEDTHVCPQTEDGRDFEFIGSIPAWNYVPSVGCELLLFYDPKDHIALTTFDWS